MAQQYRYPLTRVCLRGGTMTLPRLMLGLFPESGEVVVVDTEAGAEHTLEMSHPRVVAGLGPLYREHDLDVNDELLIQARPDGRFDVTPVRRPRTVEEPARAEPVPESDADGEEPAATSENSAEAAAGAGRSEPPAPAASSDEQGVVARDGSATQQGLPFNLDPRAATSEAASALADLDDLDASVRPATAAPEARQAARGESQGGADGATAGGTRRTTDGDTHGGSTGDPAEVTRAGSGSDRADAASGTAASRFLAGDRTPVNGAEGAAGRGAESANASAATAVPASGSTGAPGRQAADSSARPDAARSAHGGARRDGRGAAFEEEQDNGASLAAVALTSRLRRILGPLGYRFEPLGAGVLYLHAEMGRRTYKVLVQLLRPGERLDWAALLARRRASPANYLSVVGDRADLIRLTSPADLARATLWSWEALERLSVLHESVPVSPIDLESHFGRDGLFDQGLKRFEQSVAARVAERGATSELLTRLATKRAPSVFLLEELAQDAGMSRDAVLRILERLSEPPFHLIARVDQGEFLLRQPVAEALIDLAVYAESLRHRLPQGRREVLTGLEEPGARQGEQDERIDENRPSEQPGQPEQPEQPGPT